MLSVCFNKCERPKFRKCMSHPHTPNTLSSSFMTVTTTATTSAHQNHHTPSYVHSHNHTHLHSHTSGNGNINPASPSKRHHLVFDRQLLAQATAAAAKNGNVGAGSPLWSVSSSSFRVDAFTQLFARSSDFMIWGMSCTVHVRPIPQSSRDIYNYDYNTHD